MNEAGEEELLEFLRDIDSRLADEKLGEKITLYIFGGAAAVIAYGSKRGTVDIDADLENNKIGSKLLAWAGKGSALQEKHGIYLQIANTALMLIDEEKEYQKRSVEVFKGKLKFAVYFI